MHSVQADNPLTVREASCRTFGESKPPIRVSAMLKRNDFAEKRQFGRRQTHIRGWIKVAGRPQVACIVRDLSDGGALLELYEESWLPFAFRLTSEDKQIDRHCEIRHQRGIHIGVQFVAAATAVDTPTTLPGDDTPSWTGATRSQNPRRW